MCAIVTLSLKATYLLTYCHVLYSSSLRHRQSSATTFFTSLFADRTMLSTLHTRPAVGHSQLQDPLWLQPASRPTQRLWLYWVYIPTVTEDILVWPVLACCSALELLRMRYINLHFIYLLTYLLGVCSWYNNVTTNCRTETTTAWIVSHRREHVTQIFQCSTVHASVSDDTDFEIHSLFNRQPMEPHLWASR